MAEKERCQASIVFPCSEPDCTGSITMNAVDLSGACLSGQCPECHRIFEFDDAMMDKLKRLHNLIVAIREAEDILGDCAVGVTVPGGEVKIPYKLLLARMNTQINLELNGKKINFTFWIDPASKETFR